MLSSCADMTSRQALTAHICIGCQQQVPPREAKPAAHQKSEPQMHPDLEEAEDEEGGAGGDDSGDASIGPHCGKEDLQPCGSRSGAMLSACRGWALLALSKRGCWVQLGDGPACEGRCCRHQSQKGWCSAMRRICGCAHMETR